MARKNIFQSVMREEVPAALPQDTQEPRKFGAAKSLSASIDELARQAIKLNEGDTVVELDTALLDGSFVTDRMSETIDPEYQDLLQAIKEKGQDSPILVRPHPKKSGRYMIVFGHRRAKVAKELGIKVRAVVKQIEDLEHIVSQGQENSARSNLTFIERTLFAERLEQLGYSRDTIQAALTIDYQTLSKMLTIPRVIPEDMLSAIGPSKGVGRDRWLELRKLLENPKHFETAQQLIQQTDFKELASPARFESLYNLLKKGNSSQPVRKSISNQAPKKWASQDKNVSITIRHSARDARITVSAPQGRNFASWLEGRLDELYQDFKSDEKQITGE